MYNQDFDQRGQDVDGLDMFVGSGIDFLSEVTINDMDRELFNSNVTGPHLFSPENFTNFAPLAASLGPPGTTLGFDHRSGSFGSNPSLQMPCAEDHAGVSDCMPPQSSGNALQTNLRPDSKDPSNGDAAASGELQDPSHSSTRPAEAADARAKLRDKNKRAQKRFRERKKERAQESEKYMAGLVAEMEIVRLEKMRLEERNQLLEKVLALNQKHAPPPTKGLLELTPDTLKACPTSFGTGFQEFDPDKTLPVSVLNTEHKCMRVQDVKSMSWEQHVSIWKAYVTKLAALLATADGNPDSEAGAEVQRTLQEAIALCSCKAMHDPYGVQHFYLARMEEGRRLSKQGVPHPQAMEDMMTTVLESLSLSDQQKRELMELRCWVLPRVGRLMRDRERISQDLQACTRDSHRQEVVMKSKSLTQAHLRAADILTELYSNLKEDQVLLFQMSSAIWRKMMTPFQLANIVVQTYPWVPDTTVLLNILAAQESQPSALELLGFADGQTAADSSPSLQDLHGASALHGAIKPCTAMHKVSDGESAGVQF
ncbi:hypothetical protein ABBQ38_007898 [Trebouxia sp. C0009 RCD-2024]